MQEHIQQVSLSELMTSWSYILCLTSLPPIWWDRGVMGGVCESEYVVGGVFHSRDGLAGEGGALAPPLEEVTRELSWAPLIPGPLGLLVLALSVHPQIPVWADIQCQCGKEAAREVVTEQTAGALETSARCRWIFCFVLSDKHIHTLPPSLPFTLRSHAFFLGNGSNGNWVMSSLQCMHKDSHCQYF